MGKMFNCKECSTVNKILLVKFFGSQKYPNFERESKITLISSEKMRREKKKGWKGDKSYRFTLCVLLYLSLFDENLGSI